MALEFDGNSDVTRIPTRLFACWGLTLNPRFSNPLIFVNITLTVATIWLILIQASLGFQIALSEVLEPMQSFLLMLQSSVRTSVMCYRKKTLVAILDSSKKFWKVSNFDSAIRQKVMKLLKDAESFNEFFIAMTFLVALSFIFEPLISGEMPLKSYVPEGWRIHLIFVHIYVTMVTWSSLVSQVIFFDAVCAETIVQFQLLGHEFESVSAKTNLKRLIDHHNFLVDFCKLLNVLASEIIIMQFLFTTLACCIELFITLQEGFTLHNKIQGGSFLTAQLIEFYIYCFSGQSLSKAASAVDDAIYRSNWHRERSLELRRSVVLVMARAQREVVVICHGFVVANLTTFTVVFKSVLSFYTYLKTICS